MAYTIKINPEIFTTTGANIHPKLNASGKAKSVIYVGPISTREGGMPVYSPRPRPNYFNEGKFLLKIDAIGISMEDNAFQRMSIPSLRSQLADMVRRDIIVINDGAGDLTVDDVLTLWERTP